MILIHWHYKISLKNGAYCITDITRPNNGGGTCIDLIMTNCVFVAQCGVSDDMVSDHFLIFCIRKKKKEKKVIKTEKVRDLKNYNEKFFLSIIG